MLDAITSIAPAGALIRTSDALQPQSAGSAPGADFSQMLAQVAADATGSLRSGEAAAMAGIQGKAPVQDVVDAVLNAERALQTTLAVRDKLVSAFQEISRMAI
jgi:flagellar hook-basal body complex protein FliE